MWTVHLLERDRRELYAVASALGLPRIAAAAATACPTARGLCDQPCPCHPSEVRLCA